MVPFARPPPPSGGFRILKKLRSGQSCISALGADPSPADQNRLRAGFGIQNRLRAGFVGRSRTSAIAKSDLTVMSAGVCLAGGDRTFDLQSLVGVVQGSWE